MKLLLLTAACGVVLGALIASEPPNCSKPIPFYMGALCP